MTMIFAGGLLAKVYAGGVSWLAHLWLMGYTLAFMRKSPVGCTGELAGDVNRNTQTFAANGLLSWNPTGIDALLWLFRQCS